MMLDLVFHALPFRTLQKIFPKIFTIPVISFSNLGIIDQYRLCFGDVKMKDAYLTAAVKKVPYFQLTASTFEDGCTLSANLYGTVQDRKKTEQVLAEVEQELLEEINVEC